VRDVLFSYAMLLIGLGLALAGFGLSIFYAWLPLFYVLGGLELGLLLGNWIFGASGSTPIVLGLLGAGTAGAAYFLEAPRRVVIGYLGGSLAALSLLSLLGPNESVGWIVGGILIIGGCAIGATIPSRFLDLFVMSVSALCGAALIVIGAQLLLSIAGAPISGSAIPLLLAASLTIIGIRFQSSHRDRTADDRGSSRQLTWRPD
jgi:hypothetical protein